MLLVVIGALLLLCKLAELGPVADWSWWIILAPFAGAVLWWQFSDTSGLTARRAMDRMERRKTERREKAMVGLGLDPARARQAAQARSKADKRRPNDSAAKSDRDASRDRTN